MATIWQYPRTWTAGELAVSSHMNREIRDNMLASQAAIAETVLAAASTAVTLTPPSTVWNNWRIIASIHATNGIGGTSFNQALRLNGVASTVYQYAGLQWLPGSSVAGASTGLALTGQTDIFCGYASDSTNADTIASLIINIAGVNSTRHKLVTVMNTGSINHATFGGAVQITYVAGIFRSTASITSAQLFSVNANTEYSIGSVFTMIGLP